MGVFPEWLEYAVVISLHKKGDVSNMADYRPISLLPVFSKVFEKSVEDYLGRLIFDLLHVSIYCL